MNRSCYLIGEDSLLIQCANQLFSQNYTIELVISPTKSIQQWAKNHDIPLIKSFNDFDISQASKVDYIFSIVNSHFLPSTFVQLARQAVINYHDSLLPDYAGLNATSWALLNGEKQHGITWHLVSDQIDKGAILVQHSFPIEETDTALTLNLRCYEQAIVSFTELLDKIKNNCLFPKLQSPKHRRYFSATHLLPDLGFINWKTMSAQLILRLHRALVLGHYKNNIGQLKIYLHSDFLIVTEVHLLDINSEAKKPGTILNVSLSEMQVVTCNEVINLRFTTLTKQKISTDIITQYNLLPGMKLPSLPSHYQFIQLHSENYRNALQHEQFWIKKLQNTVEHNIFSSQSASERQFYQTVESTNVSQLLQNRPHQQVAMVLLIGLMIYFFRLNNYEKTSCFFIPDTQSISQEKLPGLFPNFIPLSLPSMKSAFSLEKMAQIIEKEYQNLLNHSGYLGDIFSRQSELENYVAPSIVIGFSTMEFQRLPSSTAIYIHIDKKSGTITCYHRLNNDYRNGAILHLISYFNLHLYKIIAQFLTNPQILINEFSFLSDSERQFILQAGCGDRYSLPSESITTIFEKNVERYLEHPAILMNDDVISYLKLWQMAEIIADALKEIAAPKTFVGIYTLRSPTMLAIILGILKADCVYVPLDPKYPLGKINLIATDAQLAFIITTSSFFEKLNNFFIKQPNIALLDAEQLLSNFCKTNKTKNFRAIHLRSAEDRLAYIMFTSGTTGAPKGVMVSQHNVINYCCWFSKTTNCTHQSIIDFSSSIAFDLSVPCTIAPLLVGGTIAICSNKVKINPKMYLKHLHHYEISHAELTPGYLELLLNYPKEIRQLQTLKYLMLGADVLHVSEVNEWLSLSPQTQVINEYGPTETTVSVTSYFIKPDIVINDSTVPIGKPAFNSYCYVLDKYNNLCPFGMKGELHIGGEQVALGYLRKPQTTAEKFISLNFTGEPIRLYKTGDEVCWYPDGQLQFFGRNDFQVKIHGYRIELPAIETMLMQYPAIHQAVVIVKKNRKEKCLCAYLVITGQSIIHLDELKTFLANYLPFYMMPKEFYIVDSIPLKENEKIDFKHLESQIQQQLLHSPTLSQDRLSSTQQYCLNTWQAAFNRQSIQLKDNFFDLGGDSLIALQIITALKTYYSLPISLSCLFECPTIVSLANKIDLLITQSQKNPLQNLANSLVKLTTGSYPIPIFLIHPVGGSIFWYQQLAQYLERKYTIYGIQDPNIDEESLQFNTLQEMATFYLEAIATVYQGKRYCLGGASFGATVAFEMAHQLQQRGLEIQFLGLLDGWAHYPAPLMKETALSLLSHSKQYLTEKQRLKLARQEEHRKGLLINYSIPILNTHTTLFKAHELWKDFIDIDDPFNGWLPYIHGQITVYSIPGNHETMFFNPNVEQLTKVFLPDANT